MHGVIEFCSAREMREHYSDVRRRFFPVLRQPARPKPVEPEPEPMNDIQVIPVIPVLPFDASLEVRVETAINLSIEMFVRHPKTNKVLLVTSAVSQAFDVRTFDLISGNRTQHLTTPRQLVSAITRKLTCYSYPEIGRRMRRDHTTILYGARKYAALVDAAFNRRNENDIPA